MRVATTSIMLRTRLGGALGGGGVASGQCWPTSTTVRSVHPTVRNHAPLALSPPSPPASVRVDARERRSSLSSVPRRMSEEYSSASTDRVSPSSEFDATPRRRLMSALRMDAEITPRDFAAPPLTARDRTWHWIANGVDVAMLARSRRGTRTIVSGSQPSRVLAVPLHATRLSSPAAPHDGLTTSSGPIACRDGQWKCCSGCGGCLRRRCD